MRYRLSPLFVLRMAGVPFDAIERVATPASMALARSVRSGEAQLRELAAAALAALRTPDPTRPQKVVDKARRALGQGHKLHKDAPALAAEVAAYAERYAAVDALRAELAGTLDRELAAASRELAAFVAGPLRRYSVFAASQSVSERLDAAGDERDGRGWRERAEDRLHLNYLQRLAAKNDTISEFGPTGWGRVDPDARGISLAPVPGIARRDVFLEKWVSTELAAAMTADADARLEASVRLAPNGRVMGDAFVWEDTGTRRPLAADERAALARLPIAAHALDRAVLDRLAGDGVVVWRFEAPALDSHRARVLRADVAAWRDGAARAKWLPIFDRLVAAVDNFASGDVEARRTAFAAAEAEVAAIGDAKQRGRSLYAAANVIGEECARDCNFVLGGDVATRFCADAAPWLDLFSDTTAYAWQRVTAKLAELYASAPRRDGVVALPAFVRHAEAAGVALGGDGIARVANAAFREVQQAFEQELDARADAPEVELGADDCHLVRRRFGPLIPPPVWLAVDLQIAAASTAAVAAGNYDVVVGEVNCLCPVAAHVFFWGCPDRTALATELRRLIGVDRACHVDLRVLDRANHVAFHWHDVFGPAWTGVVGERLAPELRRLDPAHATVSAAESGELRVHGPNGEDLGALVNAWDMPFALGVHPFMFRRGRHLSRLRVGRAILQRRTWIVGADELPRGTFTGTSPALLGAIDALRAARDLPRHAFVRPTDRALGERFSASGRDKDVKPFYIDFESYLFVEAFHGRLAKYGELEVVEMSPAPDQLVWQEADGRRTFELRALCGPG